jgi:DASS family divalent anion:Na+ symporter
MSSPAVAPPQPVASVSTPATPSKQLRKWIGPLALGLLLVVIPAPSGLSATAWHYFALFAAVIAGLITEPLPGAAIGFIGSRSLRDCYWLGKRPPRLRNGRFPDFPMTRCG